MSEKRFTEVYGSKKEIIGVVDNVSDNKMVCTLDLIQKMNSLAKENEELQDTVYDELENALKVLGEIYEDYPKDNVHRLYNNLKGLKEMME